MVILLTKTNASNYPRDRRAPSISQRRSATLYLLLKKAQINSLEIDPILGRGGAETL